MKKDTTYPIGDGAHKQRGQFVKSHPNTRCLSVSPVHQRRCALISGHEGEHACNGAVWSVDLGDMFGYPSSELSRGQVEAARPPRQAPARDTLPTTPPPFPRYRWETQQLDRLSAERDEARAAVRELLDLYDATKAALHQLHYEVATARPEDWADLSSTSNCWLGNEVGFS